jgi:hypothetical protein
LFARMPAALAALRWTGTAFAPKGNHGATTTDAA